MDGVKGRVGEGETKGDARGSLRVKSHRELRVYQGAMDAAMRVFEVTKSFPQEERYSLVDQMRRSSRSVCANLAEAWRKRRYQAAFVAKLNDAEGEACETQVWIDFASQCRYLDAGTCRELDQLYDRVLAQLVCMIDDPEKWTI